MLAARGLPLVEGAAPPNGASDPGRSKRGQHERRRFEGGTANFHRAWRQVYVVLRIIISSSDIPRAILLEGAAGEVVRRALQATDANRESMFAARPPEDAAFLRLISDPTSTERTPAVVCTAH
jgi:hypothetical protein